MRKAILSVLHLFVVSTFFLTGLFFILLPSQELRRAEIIDFFTNHYQMCSQIGVIIFLVGVILLFGFYHVHRGKYLVIGMNVKADLKMIRQTTENCLAKHFSKKIFLKDVEIGSKSLLEFTVHFAPMDETDREELYAAVEKQLGILLQERFGSTKSFRLIVNV